MDAFMERPEETLKRLGVDKEKGLSAAEVEKSRKVNGENAFTKEKQESLGRRIFAAASEPMLIMLLAAAFITLAELSLEQYLFPL